MNSVRIINYHIPSRVSYSAIILALAIIISQFTVSEGVAAAACRQDPSKLSAEVQLTALDS